MISIYRRSSWFKPKKDRRCSSSPPVPPVRDHKLVMIETIFDNQCIFECNRMYRFARSMTDPLLGEDRIPEGHQASIKGFNNKIMASLFGGGALYLWDDIWNQYALGLRELLARYKNEYANASTSNFIQLLYQPALHTSLVQHGLAAQLFFFEKTMEIFNQCLLDSGKMDKIHVTFIEPDGIDHLTVPLFHGGITGIVHLAPKRTVSSTSTTAS